MVDFECLSVWPIDTIRNARGYTCEKCGRREAISLTTSSLEEALRKLNRYSPGQRQFQYLLAKALKKAEALSERRGECNGSQQHQNLASSRSLG